MLIIALQKVWLINRLIYLVLLEGPPRQVFEIYWRMKLATYGNFWVP